MTDTNLETFMLALGQSARDAAAKLRNSSADERTQALTAVADAIAAQSEAILSANQMDVGRAAENGLSDAMLDRLRLDPSRLDSVVASVRNIAAQDDPLGEVLDSWTQPNGLSFSKVSIPIGVIGMIYESRPNVTADAAALCLKSGNAVILRGGSEAVETNRALYAAIGDGLAQSRLPKAAVQIVMTQDRAAVGAMLGGLGGAIDLIIPRGGKGLVARVQQDARVPVLAHLDGLNHTYIQADADLAMALDVVENAKMRRTGICGATETVLVDQSIAADIVPPLVARLTGRGCEVRGDKASQNLSDGIVSASAEDYATEHLAAIVNLAIVRSLDAALDHIAAYGSGHTDAIITDDEAAARRFLDDVDSAIVLHNASTQFADGGEFGFGAEIGIATGRLHARGPVGARQLTSYKYQVVGQGTLRP